MKNTRETNASAVVLYVEDEPLNVMLMRAVFDYRPMLDLVIATNGSEAMRMAPDLNASMLLVDLNLPDCHGTALLRHLRGVKGWADLPAVAVTADQAFKSKGTGFCEVWHKPFMLFHTLTRIDQLLMPERGEKPPQPWRFTPLPAV